MRVKLKIEGFLNWAFWEKGCLPAVPGDHLPVGALAKSCRQPLPRDEDLVVALIDDDLNLVSHCLRQLRR